MVRISVVIDGKGLDMRVDKRGNHPPSFAYFEKHTTLNEIDEDKIIDAMEKIEEAVK